MKFNINNIKPAVSRFFSQHIGQISADTLGWLAPIVIHCATVPSLLALLTGLSDKTPPIDVVLFMWAGLILLFGRAIILKDMFNIITIGTGFVVQAIIMALILFK